MKVDGVAIEVHNHFIQGGAQYSLHIKFGAGSFQKGPELGPKTDASVYASISQGRLAVYTTWVKWQVGSLYRPEVSSPPRSLMWPDHHRSRSICQTHTGRDGPDSWLTGLVSR